MNAALAEDMSDSEDEAPKGLWSDVAPIPEQRRPETMPPPIPAAALKPPRLPQLPGMMALVDEPLEEELLEEEPVEDEPELEPTDERIDMTPALAFRVQPSVESTVEPVGTAMPPAPPVSSAPPKRVSSTQSPKALRNPWVPNTVPPPEEAQQRADVGGPDLRSGTAGFVLGIAVAAAVAFFLWPESPVAEVVETPAAATMAVEPEVTEIGAAVETEESASTLEQMAEPAEEAMTGELVIEEPTLEIFEQPGAPTESFVASETTSEATPEMRARWAENRRARRAEAATAEPTPAAPDAPAIGAEPTLAPRPQTPTEVAVIDTNLPTTPSRDDVAGAIRAIQSQLQECAPSHRGHVANIRFTFTSAGRATAALVPHDFAGPAERSCVARAARNARVPAFSDPRLVVTYPVSF